MVLSARRGFGVSAFMYFLVLPGSVNFDKHFEGKMEGYLEIFGRKLCGKKGNFGLWRRKWEWKHCSRALSCHI